MTAFFIQSDADDIRYRTVRDGTVSSELTARRFTEDLWTIAGEFLDPRVRFRARSAFCPVFWELYLAAAVLSAGLPLVKYRERRFALKGPDCQIGSPATWIEATAPSRGSGPDAVPELQTGVFGPVPANEIKLRFISSIVMKHDKYLEYRSQGIVEPSEPYVVAINATQVPSARLETHVPWIVSAVFPFGDESFDIDLRTHEIVRRYFQYKGQIEKQSGSEVPTTLFENPNFAGISAILSSVADAWNGPRELGADFVVVHNPLAANPIPRGFFGAGREYWRDGNKIEFRHHSEEQIDG